MSKYEEWQKYQDTDKGQLEAWELGLADEAGGMENIDWRKIAEWCFLTMQGYAAIIGHYQEARRISSNMLDKVEEIGNEIIKHNHNRGHEYHNEKIPYFGVNLEDVIQN
jgi:hypothetical protein